MPAQTCLPETTPGDQVELKRLAHAVCHPDLEGPAAGLGTREAPVPRRNIVERAVGWYKGCRRLGTRYEKPAVNHLAFWMVAMIEKDLRLLGSSDRALTPGHRGPGHRGRSGHRGPGHRGPGHRGQTDLEFFRRGHRGQTDLEFLGDRGGHRGPGHRGASGSDRFQGIGVRPISGGHRGQTDLEFFVE